MENIYWLENLICCIQLKWLSVEIPLQDFYFSGSNLCCSGCDQSPSVHVNLVTVIFKADNIIEPGKINFEIIIISGSDSGKLVSFHIWFCCFL